MQVSAIGSWWHDSIVQIGYNCARPKKSQGPESRHAEVRRRRGSWRREGGDKDKDRGAGCISEQCSASECTHPAGQQDVWCAQLHHHCSLPLARVLKNNMLVPKENCLEGSTSEFCFPLISPPRASLVILRVLSFFINKQNNAIHCIADKTHYFSCQKFYPIFGLTSSLLHPAPSQPVTLSKPTAFLGHYPSRGSAVLWLDTPTLFSQITTHNLA